MEDDNFDLATRSDANVLITGPTGVGKTCLARKIHEESHRAHGPFVVVNLASLHEGTLESELFGHERGAFTGAFTRRNGRLQQAQHGTVFLDEIGDLSLPLQARLLEFLQFKEFTPVGGDRRQKLDVRIIAATHRDLEGLAQEGKFRSDLLHRVRVLSIYLPSLAERGDELDAWVHRFLRELNIKCGKRIERLDLKVVQLLEGYSWPGNLRELQNVLESAVLRAQSSCLQMEDLPRWFREKSEKSLGTCSKEQIRVPFELDYYGMLCAFEKQYFSCVLKRFGGRINATSRAIGLSKSTLIRRVRAHRLVG